jgi:hypothetical protein
MVNAYGNKARKRVLWPEGQYRTCQAIQDNTCRDESHTHS